MLESVYPFKKKNCVNVGVVTKIRKNRGSEQTFEANLVSKIFEIVSDMLRNNEVRPKSEKSNFLRNLSLLGFTTL
jgi:hypothetical protein